MGIGCSYTLEEEGPPHTLTQRTCTGPGAQECVCVCVHAYTCACVRRGWSPNSSWALKLLSGISWLQTNPSRWVNW